MPLAPSHVLGDALRSLRVQSHRWRDSPCGSKSMEKDYFCGKNAFFRPFIAITSFFLTNFE